MTYSLREGKDTAKTCTSSDGSKLPGFSSKLEASQQIAGGDLGTTPTMGGPALGLPVGFYAGVIKFWNADKGFGFVVPEGGGDDVFVHVRDVDQMQVLNQGDQVIFRLEQKNQGPRPQAVQVSLRNAPRTPAIPQQAAAAYDPYGAAAANPYGYPAAGAYAQQAAYGAAAAYPGYGAPDQYSQQAAYS